MTQIHAVSSEREPHQQPDQRRAAILEALLFTHGEPMPVKRLAEAALCTSEEAIASLNALADALSGRGIMLVERDGAYQLVTRPEYGTHVSSLKKRDLTGPLTDAQLETLAVIAYRGPARKSDVDYIRGVNSSFTIRNLLTRGLIHGTAPAAADDRIPRYQISNAFLNHLGLTTVTELPSYGEFQRSGGAPTES